MKKIHSSLVALLLITSVGTAFATKSKLNANATLYDVLATNSDGTYSVRIDDGTGSCIAVVGPCTVSSSQVATNGKISQSSAVIVDVGIWEED